MGRITGTGTAGSPAPFLSMGAIIHRHRVVASIVCVCTRYQQQQTIDTLTAALSTAQALTAGSLQTLHQLTAPVTVATARTEETPEKEPETEERTQPESVPVEHESPQAPSDRTDKPKTSGEEKGVETITQQGKPVERPTEAPQSKAQPKRGVKKEQPRKGLFSFLRK